MGELQVFKNAEFGSVCSLTVNGEPYFVDKYVDGMRKFRGIPVRK